jgi:hypothetical protein
MNQKDPHVGSRAIAPILIQATIKNPHEIRSVGLPIRLATGSMPIGVGWKCWNRLLFEGPHTYWQTDPSQKKRGLVGFQSLTKPRVFKLPNSAYGYTDR